MRGRLRRMLIYDEKRSQLKIKSLCTAEKTRRYDDVGNSLSNPMQCSFKTSGQWIDTEVRFNLQGGETLGRPRSNDGARRKRAVPIVTQNRTVSNKRWFFIHSKVWSSRMMMFFQRVVENISTSKNIGPI